MPIEHRAAGSTDAGTPLASKQEATQKLLRMHREQWSGQAHYGLTFGQINELCELLAAELSALQQRNAELAEQVKAEREDAERISKLERLGPSDNMPYFDREEWHLWQELYQETFPNLRAAIDAAIDRARGVKLV